MYNFGDECYSWFLLPKDCNWRRYEQLCAPQYSLANIRTRLSIYYGGKDILATPEDVRILLQALPNSSLVSYKELANYGHLDFVWGESAHILVYNELGSFLSASVQAS